MTKNRMFYLLAVTALCAVAVLTAFQAVSAAELAAEASTAQTQAAGSPNCAFTAADGLSIEASYVAGGGGWLPQTDNGPTGVDGGLISLKDC